MLELETAKPGTPKHKILCRRKFYRYVVACMHNCQEPHFCEEFWGFFKAVGKTPAEYFNENGIGEATMRRVVFDCDRCGKKDIGVMYGLCDEHGEQAENRLSEEAFARQVERMGFKDILLVGLTGTVLDKLSEARRWHHYCDKCFRRVVEDLADVALMKRSAGKPKVSGDGEAAAKAAKDAAKAREAEELRKAEAEEAAKEAQKQRKAEAARAAREAEEAEAARLAEESAAAAAAAPKRGRPSKAAVAARGKGGADKLPL